MSRDDSDLPAPSRRQFMQGSVASAVGMGSALLGAAPSSGARAQPMRSSVLLHDVQATAETVHWGYFSKQLKPVIEVSSGDYVTLGVALFADEQHRAFA